MPGRKNAAQVQDRKQLIDFARKWTDKGVEIYVISRPEAYGEYGPYTFLVSLGMLDGALEDYMARKGDGE